jgi:hypothetical protein
MGVSACRCIGVSAVACKARNRLGCQVNRTEGSKEFKEKKT